VGVNRLENGRSVNRVPVPAASAFGAEEVELNDRQKVVAMISATLLGKGKKLKIYGEFHRVGATERALDGSFTETEPLPDDLGFLLGAQLGLWDFARNGHLNVWLRYAQGLAVFDELGTPFGLNRDRRSVDAKEYRLAVAGAAEKKLRGASVLGVQFGSYARMFIDADGQEEDFDDRLEVAAVVRPEWMYHLWSFGAEASLQVSRPNGLNPQTNQQSVARVMQFALLPGWTWSREQGVFSRPQLRGIFAATILNDAALDLYARDDPRSQEKTSFYIGARAEWWFGRGGGY
jgi:maltoporin